MKYKLMLYVIAVMGLAGLSTSAYSLKPEHSEFSLLLPYWQGETFEFDGGASAEVNSDLGFGFSFAYNVNEHLAGRVDVSWNSAGYDAERILDDGLNTVERVTGKLDTFNFGFGADYYFTTGKVAPYVSANLGWSSIDTNISDGDSFTSCWWDPWWGYMCSTYRSTYSDTSVYYGLGVGLRFEFNRHNYLKVGYVENWLDFDRAKGSPSMGSARIEFGFTY